MLLQRVGNMLAFVVWFHLPAEFTGVNWVQLPIVNWVQTPIVNWVQTPFVNWVQIPIVAGVSRPGLFGYI